MSRNDVEPTGREGRRRGCLERPRHARAGRGAPLLLSIRALPLAEVAALGRGGVIMSIWAFHYLTFAFRFFAFIAMRHVAWAQSTFV